MNGLAKTLDTSVDVSNAVKGRAMTSILTAASDIALVLDEAGVIRDVTLGQTDYPIEGGRRR